MSRWKAAAIHLSISATIGLLSAALIFGVWYPPPYSKATGADELVLLLMGVDVVLGPLLTLVVFRTGKKSLRFDLGVIALMQSCAFLYGMSVVVRARPVFVVGIDDRFVVVLANDIDRADLEKGKDAQFRALPWTGPRIIGAEVPTDQAEKSLLLDSAAVGKDIEKLPRYYVPFDAHASALLARAQPLDGLKRKHDGAGAIIDAWLLNEARPADSVRWLPLVAPRGDLAMLLDSRTGKALGALSIDPW